MDGLADLSFGGLVGYLLGAYFFSRVQKYFPEADMKYAAILGAVVGIALQRVLDAVGRAVHGIAGRKFKYFERIVEVLWALKAKIIRPPEAAKYLKRIRESYFVGDLETAASREK